MTRRADPTTPSARVAYWRGDTAADASACLVCIPHAGAGTNHFRTWREVVPPEVDLCALRLPARESRIDEPPLRAIDEIVDECAETVAGVVDAPVALFGYCFGAFVALELARRLERLSATPVVGLFLAEQPFAAPDGAERQVHELPTDRLVAHLRRLRTTPPAVLDVPEMFALVEPAIRGDYAAFASYVPAAHPRIEGPVCVLGGGALPAAALARWHAVTAGEFSLRVTNLSPRSSAFWTWLARSVAHELADAASLRDGAA